MPLRGMEVFMQMKKKWLSLVVIILIIVAAGMVTRCTFKSPVLPHWELDLFIPLINETYTMADLADDISEIDTMGNQVLLNYTYEFDPLSLQDELSSSGASTSLSMPVNAAVNDSVGIPLDLILLETATIKTGSLTLTLTNNTGSPVDILLILNDMTNASGDTFSIGETVPVGPNQSFGPYSMANYVFAPPVRGGQNYINFTGSVTGAVTGALGVTLDFSDFSLSSVTGILNGIDISIDPFETEIEMPEEIDELRVGDANVFLTFGEDIPFPMDVDILIEAVEIAGGTTTETILIQQTLIPGAGDTIQVPNVADFFNSIISQPSRIVIAGDVSIGDGVTSGTISEDDTLTGKAILQAPLIFTLPAYDSDSGDPQRLDLDEDTREMIQENIKNLMLTGEIENHLPTGLTLEVLFSKDRADTTIYDPLYTPDFTISLDMAPAPNDGQNPAHVLAPVISPIDVEIDEQDIENLFADSLLYYGLRFDFAGTGGDMVEIRASDYIRIQMNFSARVDAKIPEDDDEEGGGS
jgi:hypothetical protein